jgi:hypothetical protein
VEVGYVELALDDAGNVLGLQLAERQPPRPALGIPDLA